MNKTQEVRFAKWEAEKAITLLKNNVENGEHHAQEFEDNLIQSALNALKAAHAYKETASQNKRNLDTQVFEDLIKVENKLVNFLTKNKDTEIELDKVNQKIKEIVKCDKYGFSKLIKFLDRKILEKHWFLNIPHELIFLIFTKCIDKKDQISTFGRFNQVSKFFNESEKDGFWNSLWSQLWKSIALEENPKLLTCYPKLAEFSKTEGKIKWKKVVKDLGINLKNCVSTEQENEKFDTIQIIDRNKKSMDLKKSRIYIIQINLNSVDLTIKIFKKIIINQLNLNTRFLDALLVFSRCSKINLNNSIDKKKLLKDVLRETSFFEINYRENTEEISSKWINK